MSEDLLTKSQNTNLISPPENIAPVSEQTYMGRCWECALQQWKEHKKVELTATSIATLIGIIVGASLGDTTKKAFITAIIAGLVTGIVAPIIIFITYLIRSPKLVDEKRRKEIAAMQAEVDEVREGLSREQSLVRLELENARAELAEIKKQKLIFAIDERYTTIRAVQTKSAIRIFANIRLRFENLSERPVSIRRFDITLHRMGIVNVRGHEDIFTLFAILRLHSNGVQLNNETFEGLTIEGHHWSPYYEIETMLAIDLEEDEQIDAVELLDTVTYLRIAMECSGNQPEFIAKLFPHWDAALKPDGTTLVHVIDAPSIAKDYRRLG